MRPGKGFRRIRSKSNLRDISVNPWNRFFMRRTGGFFKEMTEAEKRLAILDEAVTTFGKEKQVDMMIEEMAELTKALLNERRGRESNISEEIADVLIMAEQMKIIFNNADSVEAYRQGKINRLAIKIATIKSGGEE